MSRDPWLPHKGAANISQSTFIHLTTLDQSIAKSWREQADLIHTTLNYVVQGLHQHPIFISQEQGDRLGTKRVMSAVCDHCVQNVPLDLFLPLQALGSYHRGLAWFLGVEVFKGETAIAELDASRRKGCPLCKIMWTALEAAEPIWATNDFKGTGHNKLLHAPRQHLSKEKYEPGIKVMVTVEGEMKITDGRRTSGAYWELKSKGYGKVCGT
jgi:hypothetical protein